MHRNLRSVRAAAAVFLVFGSISCVFPTKDDKGPVANDPPTVRIIEGAANEGASGVDYRVRFRWTGFDADGMVSAFRWAVDTDDENADTWTTTTDSSIFLTFQTTTPDPDGTHYTDWHSFSIQAIDNEGARSTVVTQMFNARTIAPTSRITFPLVADTGFLTLWSSAKMEWTGEDLDATDPDLTPTAFEYKLARLPQNFTSASVLDSLADGVNVLTDAASADPTEWIRDPERRLLWLADLVPELRYTFAVRAVDEAGAVEPRLDWRRNYFAFQVTASIPKPNVTMSEPLFGSHHYSRDDDTWTVEVVSGRPVRLSWEGDASAYGSRPGATNYALDIPNVDDDTLEDPSGIGGWIGWDERNGLDTPFVFPASDDGVEHHFWLKMADEQFFPEGERLCHIRLRVVALTFERNTLIVDDARFQGSVTDAEHDAFVDETIFRSFYDYGGVDHHSAWIGNQEQGATIPLSMATLGMYRNVVWLFHSIAVGQLDPLEVIEKDYRRLSSYSAAGGRIFMVGGPLACPLLDQRSDCSYPITPPTPFAPAPDFSRESFLWQFMKYQNVIVNPSSLTTSAEREAGGMIAARSLQPAYPDIQLDPAKWNPYELVNQGQSFRGGTRFWDGVLGRIRPVAQIAGLDSLYAVATMDTTVCCGSYPSELSGAIVGQRYQSTQADTLAGTQQGRLLVLDFEPWYFDPQALTEAGAAAVQWLETGSDR